MAFTWKAGSGASHFLAAALVTLDLALIGLALGLGLAHRAGLLAQNPRFLGLADPIALASLWNYAKWLVIAGCFAAMWWRGRVLLHAVAAAIFLGVLLDDALEMHEWVGALLERYRPGWSHDLGEAAILLLLACGAALLIGLAWRRAPAAVRRGFVPVVMTVGALLVFAVGLDFLQSLARSQLAPGAGGMVAALLGLVEDGAELICASLILDLSWILWRSAPTPAAAES